MMRANLVVALLATLGVVGCGGGGSTVSGANNSGGGGGTPPPGSNVQSVIVDNGPSIIASGNSPAVNTLYTSVTICVPGTSTCQTIDHIQVDTGSSGLRIISSSASGGVLTLNLPQQKDSSGNALAECVQFVDGSSWGTVRTADIKIAGEVASNQAVQIIGDAAYTAPTGSPCSGSGTTENDVASFGANGILGVGPFIQDCGPACTQTGNNTYYSCASASSCTNIAMPLSAQLLNPVAAFATDNNGVIIQLGSVNGTAASVSGSLIFGIGTQGNNGIGQAKVFTLDDTGALTTVYSNQPLSQSFIDSGSNAYYFPNPPNSNTAVIPVCAKGTSAAGFFCPTSTLNLSASIVGVNQIMATVNFSVANANSLFQTSSMIAAASTLAAPSTSVATDGSTFNGNNTFDWGLPFYYGRSVYTAIETMNTSAGMGPYFAF